MTLPNFFDFTLSTSTISAHVLLMRAIHKLQARVQPGGIPRRHEDGVPQPSGPTAAFLRNAVVRFTTWVMGLRTGANMLHGFNVDELDVPPLDVLMVWHAYMLSPVTYEKDSSAIPRLRLLTHMPLEKIAALVDEASYDFVPSMAQSEAWRNLTGMPFDYMSTHHYDFDAKPRIASIDLVQAVMRQSSSIGPMIHEALVYEENGLSWSQTINRYIRFMCLPLEALVPPVDVDVIWHTHQLKGAQYREDCIKYFGRVINHDDSKPADVIRKGRKMMNEQAKLLFDNTETSISVFTVFTPIPDEDSGSGGGQGGNGGGNGGEGSVSGGGQGGNGGGNGGEGSVSGGGQGGNGGGNGGERANCGGPPSGCIRS